MATSACSTTTMEETRSAAATTEAVRFVRPIVRPALEPYPSTTPPHFRFPLSIATFKPKRVQLTTVCSLPCVVQFPQCARASHAPVDTISCKSEACPLYQTRRIIVARCSIARTTAWFRMGCASARGLLRQVPRLRRHIRHPWHRHLWRHRPTHHTRLHLPCLLHLPLRLPRRHRRRPRLLRAASMRSTRTRRCLCPMTTPLPAPRRIR